MQGDMGLSPGPGRSHMPWSNSARAPQLLSPRATTTEAHAPRAHVSQQEKSPQWEAGTATKSSPRSLQLEKACAQQRRHNAAKKKKRAPKY